MCARRGLQAHVVSPEGNRVRSVLLRGLTVPSMTDGASPNVPGIRRQACRGPEAEAYCDLGYCRFDGIRCLHRAMGQRHASQQQVLLGAHAALAGSRAWREFRHQAIGGGVPQGTAYQLQPANLEVIQRVHAKLSSVTSAEETV
jgi:hypothetical protein